MISSHFTAIRYPTQDGALLFFFFFLMGVSDFGGAWKESLIRPGIQEVIHHTDHHVRLDLL